MTFTNEIKSKIKMADKLRKEADAKANHENYDAAIDIYRQIKEIEQTHPTENNNANQLLKKLVKITEMAQDRIDVLEKSQRHFQLNKDYLNGQHFKNALLFYPGAGDDFGPLSFFSQIEGVNQVVYADRMPINMEALRKSLEEHLHDFTISDFRPLTFDELLKGPFRGQVLKRMKKIIERLQDEVEKTITDPKYKSQFPVDNYLIPGVKMKISKNGKSVDFTYFIEEGSSVYRSLSDDVYDEKIFVLQDHGMVGPHFGGESDLYTQLRNSGKLPGYIFVAMGNTTPWPGYESINPPLYLKRGQMHRYLRVVFRRQDF